LMVEKLINKKELKTLMPRNINYTNRINELINNINNQLKEAASQDKRSISIILTEDEFFAIKNDLEFGGYYFEITSYNTDHTKLKLTIGW